MKYYYTLKNARILFISILFTLLFIIPAKAQFVDLGQDPCSTRWRQIKTDNFQIIYPDFFEQNAQYLANIYAKLYAHANTLGIKAKKMSMIEEVMDMVKITDMKNRLIKNLSPARRQRRLAGTPVHTRISPRRAIRQGEPRIHESIILHFRGTNHHGHHRGIRTHVVSGRGCHGLRNLRRS